IEKDLRSAKASLKEILQDGSFGEAGAKVVIEEFLDGVELSVFILTDGVDYLLLPTAKDYKRIGEGDKGLNTGGMGALSPAPVADTSFMAKVKEKVIIKTLNGLQAERIEYSGFLFIGLMRVGDEPYVIEYNVRMGDPETEVVLPRIESDLLGHFKALGDGTLASESIQVSEKVGCTIMMVSGGYPEKYEKGKLISGFDQIDSSSLVFHAGTRKEGDEIVTNGGRVLTVTSLDNSLEGALSNSYRNIDKLSFEKSYFRSDIGYELKAEVK
ncbi:MAG: phosphoribosylamine--glycine ligase, partial [Flavobacteriales bacterium]|nr:phosphoribosylamine--glycine ligase [Flavobacteriales bacterium]